MTAPSEASNGAVRVLSREELDASLARLRNLLENLPDHLPHATYNFVGFNVSAEAAEDRGRNGALNHALETTFCPGGRQNGPFLLNGCGPGLVAVADVLSRFTAEFPEDAVLQKWIGDLISAAEYTCQQSKGSSRKKHSAPDPTPGAEDSVTLPVTKKKKMPQASQHHPIMDRYKDEPRPEPRGPGGRPACPLVDQVSVYTRLRKENKIVYRCAGATDGCSKYHTNRDKTRILKHAGECQYLTAAMRQAVNSELAKDSPSARVEQLRANPSASTSSLRDGRSTAVEITLGPQQPPPTTTQPAAASKKTQVDLYSQAKQAGREQLTANLDLAIVNLLCVGGIPPRVADLPQWKHAWATANSAYRPASRSTLEDSHIPKEASDVSQKQFAYLSTQENLTISFDGGSLNSAEANTTIHVITEDRCVFFFEGIDSTNFSHTAVYYYESLLAVIDRIGPKRFRAICSDNTSNTTSAREKINAKYPWIMILPDCCHRLGRLCGDVCKIECFQEVIRVLRRTIKFMSKSTLSREHLRRKRVEMGITRGLVSIGKTRFASIYHSAASLFRCMPALRELCISKTITIKDVNDFYLNNRRAWQFMGELETLVSVLEPMGKSITCLESTHSTASDVYMFWLACMAGIYDLITAKEGPGSTLEESAKEEIREAMNARWMQMIEDAPHDVYFTSFLLDIRYRGHDLWNDLNPLTIKRIKIGLKPKEYPPDDLPDSVVRAGNFLLKLLRIEYEDRGTPIAGMEIANAVDTLKEQVRLFVKGQYPFNRPLPPSQDPYEWWRCLDEDKSATNVQPLAHLGRVLFSIVPNSMADERTQSSYTWMNSYLRNRQHVPTVTRMIQIRNWCKNDGGKARPVRRPTVKFRDMAKTIGTKPSASGSATARGARSKPSPSSNTKKGEESEGESSDLEWSTDEEECQWEREAGDEDATTCKPETFEMAEAKLNLKAAVLRDQLSDEPVLMPSLSVKGKAKAAQESSGSSEAKRVLVEEDWLMKPRR